MAANDAGTAEMWLASAQAAGLSEGWFHLQVHGLREAVTAVRAAGKRAVVACPRVLKPGEDGLARFYLRLGADALLIRSAGLLYRLSRAGGAGAPCGKTCFRGLPGLASSSAARGFCTACRAWAALVRPAAKPYVRVLPGLACLFTPRGFCIACRARAAPVRRLAKPRGRVRGQDYSFFFAALAAGQFSSLISSVCAQTLLVSCLVSP